MLQFCDKRSKNQYRYWFDFQIDPCVIFFAPIVQKLLKSGADVRITYSSYSSVHFLMKRKGLSGTAIGRHGGKHKLSKYCAQINRVLNLTRWARGQKIDLAVGFGSRPLAVACALLRIPNAAILDYEYVSLGVLRRCCNWLFLPEVVSDNFIRSSGLEPSKVIRFPGVKEDVYVPLFRQSSISNKIVPNGRRVLAVVRPPATSAHYHNTMSEDICHALLNRIAQTPSVLCVLVQRANDATFDKYLTKQNIVSLHHPVDGLKLIAASDLVFSGGGTMAREAAVMGVPSYSLFTGRLGAVDHFLIRSGLLKQIRSVADVMSLRFDKRVPKQTIKASESTVDFFVQSLSYLPKANVPAN